MKNKIYDCYRHFAREIAYTDAESSTPEEAYQFQTDGIANGAWVDAMAPVEWNGVDEDLNRLEFWSVIHACISKLPRNISRAFMLREIDGMTTPDICAMLSISESNFWVVMHRARLALRLCLQRNWYD